VRCFKRGQRDGKSTLLVGVGVAVAVAGRGAIAVAPAAPAALIRAQVDGPTPRWAVLSGHLHYNKWDLPTYSRFA